MLWFLAWTGLDTVGRGLGIISKENVSIKRYNILIIIHIRKICYFCVHLSTLSTLFFYVRKTYVHLYLEYGGTTN